MEFVECPVCDYGTVVCYHVIATGDLVQVCDECDALWEAEEDLTSPSVSRIEQYLSLRGLPLLRSGLERVG